MLLGMISESSLKDIPELGRGLVIMAKLWVIYDGLQLANDIRSIKVKSDNQVVVFMIISNKEDGSCFSLVQLIWGMCDKN